MNKNSINNVENSHKAYNKKFLKTVRKNLKFVNAFLDLSSSINSELDTEFCTDERGNWKIFSFSTNNNPYFVDPIINTKCKKSWNIHVHPNVKGDRQTGKGELSLEDMIYYIPRLMEPHDNLKCGCVIGEKDKNLSCLCNTEEEKNNNAKIQDFNLNIDREKRIK